MIESSTYRSILQQGIEQGIEQGERKSTIKSILKVLDTRFHIGTDQTLQLSLDDIEDLQRLETLFETALHAESLAVFIQTLITNGK